jgi:hypothetical protein
VGDLIIWALEWLGLTNESDLVAPSTQCPTAQHGIVPQVPVQAEVSDEEPPPILAEP